MNTIGEQETNPQTLEKSKIPSNESNPHHHQFTKPTPKENLPEESSKGLSPPKTKQPVVRPETRHHLVDIHGLALFLKKSTRCLQCYKDGCLSMLGNISRQTPPCVTKITIKCQLCGHILQEELITPTQNPSRNIINVTKDVTENEKPKTITSKEAELPPKKKIKITHKTQSKITPNNELKNKTPQDGSGEDTYYYAAPTPRSPKPKMNISWIPEERTDDSDFGNMKCEPSSPSLKPPLLDNNTDQSTIDNMEREEERKATSSFRFRSQTKQNIPEESNFKEAVFKSNLNMANETTSNQVKSDCLKEVGKSPPFVSQSVNEFDSVYASASISSKHKRESERDQFKRESERDKFKREFVLPDIDNSNLDRSNYSSVAKIGKCLNSITIKNLNVSNFNIKTGKISSFASKNFKTKKLRETEFLKYLSNTIQEELGRKDLKEVIEDEEEEDEDEEEDEEEEEEEEEEEFIKKEKEEEQEDNPTDEQRNIFRNPLEKKPDLTKKLLESSTDFSVEFSIETEPEIIVPDIIVKTENATDN